MQDSNYTFTSLEAAEAKLAQYVPAVKEITGKDITLQRMQPLMEALGNPQDKLKIIHVAGTSGKTSTAYYIAKMLQQPGTKVGLTVSPHIDKVTERLQINSEPIDEWTFCEELGTFLSVIEPVRPQPTYFELLVAFAYWYFEKSGVDIAVVETGFGGLHDGTNVAQSSDKVCVITDIGLDHIAILGDTLPKIAAQKAGIIHPGNQVFTYRQPSDVMEVFERHCREVGATLHVVEQETLRQQFGIDELSELPLFQQRNWLLARQVCEYVAKISSRETANILLEESTSVQVPGRMEIMQVAQKTLLLDGAHNQQKMQAFAESFQQYFPGRKATVLLSLKKDKAYRQVFKILKPITDVLIVTSFDALQDLPVSSMDPEVLAAAAKQEGFNEVHVLPNIKDAYMKLVSMPGSYGIVTGSFYLLGLIRKLQSKQKIRVMAAIDSDRGLADEKGIPWDLPSDRAYLRDKTMGGVLLMGYNTYQEFGIPMPGRRNIVLVRKGTQVRDGFEPVYNVAEFMAHPPDALWLFGGAGAFKRTMNYADELYLTRVSGSYGCTKFLPEFESDFELVEQSSPQQENGINFRYEIWQRKH